MCMDFSIDLFIYALEKSIENDLWEDWKLQYPNMSEETFISFDDYKAMKLAKKHTEISYGDIEKEMAKVEKAFAEGR